MHHSPHPQVRVHWDERLHGRTEDDGKLYSYWESADNLLAMLDDLAVRRATLVGHSQGGSVHSGHRPVTIE
jgi:pimeloyl-ACP methyl ester carboxylesterase